MSTVHPPSDQLQFPELPLRSIHASTEFDTGDDMAHKSLLTSTIHSITTRLPKVLRPSRGPQAEVVFALNGYQHCFTYHISHFDMSWYLLNHCRFNQRLKAFADNGGLMYFVEGSQFAGVHLDAKLLSVSAPGVSGM